MGGPHRRGRPLDAAGALKHILTPIADYNTVKWPSAVGFQCPRSHAAS